MAENGRGTAASACAVDASGDPHAPQNRNPPGFSCKQLEHPRTDRSTAQLPVQAKRLAERTGRSDVCALPYGINTVSLFAHVFLVMLLTGGLLLREPDFGAFAVITVIAMGILFLGGMNWRLFAGLFVMLIVGLVLSMLIPLAVAGALAFPAAS